MLKLRLGKDRGHLNFGWLDTFHTFSFGEYVDPNHKGFRSLRVINEDRVAPGKGFQTHAHNDMEILTYIIAGALEHKDSMGNGSVIRAGEIQYMSAGTGVTHSEFNPQPDKEVHLLQIWIRPDKKGYSPRYAQKQIPNGDLTLLAGPERSGALVDIRQNAKLFVGNVGEKLSRKYSIEKNHGIWIHSVKGEIQCGDTRLAAGDGMSMEEESKIFLQSSTPSQFLLFDLG